MFRRILILICVSFVLIALHVPGQADWETISVMEIQGQAQVKRAGAEQWQPMTGGIINKGDTIRTGPRSRLILKLPLAQANVLRLYSNSELELTEFGKDSFGAQMKVAFHLAKGNAWAWIDRLDRTRLVQLNILTPNSKVAVIGTRFAVSTWEPLETYVCSCDGRVEVSNKAGMVTLYKSKRTTIVGQDKPSTPRASGTLDWTFVIDNPYEPKLGFCMDCHKEDELECLD